MAGRVLICSETFWYTNDAGESVLISQGQRVREGHPVTLGGRESLFKVDDTPILEFEPAVVKPAVKSAPIEAPAEVKRSPGRPPKSRE